MEREVDGGGMEMDVLNPGFREEEIAKITKNGKNAKYQNTQTLDFSASRKGAEYRKNNSKVSIYQETVCLARS